MKKQMAALAVCAVFAAIFTMVGCSGSETFEAKNYSSGEADVRSVVIDVEDRAVEGGQSLGCRYPPTLKRTYLCAPVTMRSKQSSYRCVQRGSKFIYKL